AGADPGAQLAVRGVRGAPQPALAGGGDNSLAARHFPDRQTLTARGDALAAVQEADGVRAAAEHAGWAAARGLPQPNPLAAGTGEPPAVGGKGEAVDPPSVAEAHGAEPRPRPRGQRVAGPIPPRRLPLR